MKVIFRTAVVAALILTASCGKDDAPSGGNETDQQAEILEQTPLEISSVVDNVIISGSTKMEGTPPSPNEAISIDISNASKTAFLNEGFEIPFSSDGNVVGAYLQFKSNDGTVSDSYYDVNVSDNSSSRGISNKIESKKGFFSRAKKVDEATLDIDFNAQIEPGTFCYVVCVYDEQGNISAPRELCVTVESWGGNSAVVGRWSLVKQELTEDGQTEVFNLGDPDCDEWTASCANGQELEMSVCYTQEYGILELKSDGSFLIDFKGDDQNYDDEAFSQCQLEYTEDTVYRFQSFGNWAYVTDEERLTLVQYSAIVEEDGETFNETAENGDAELVFDGTLQVNGDSFVLTASEDDTYSYKLFFEK